ncbi:hypothetical protein CDCA_CDCA12G3352 [Cyanidium caldarium]|uniref:PRONE domain-containing protein n=1 Tax=Cyanidium caldarium TaxID=2771 RepID=A0AAV9IYH4_CYACA|nr:hypothetical protein CDCA_CDCA12G3352 [Cyanidium caldarium]
MSAALASTDSDRSGREPTRGSSTTTPTRAGEPRRYSTAFRQGTVQPPGKLESARASVVLARLLAEDAAAAEAREAYEAAYERYFASVDALFRAVSALDEHNEANELAAIRAAPVSPTALEVDEEAVTLREVCNTQIEALIARCEALREFMYEQTAATTAAASDASASDRSGSDAADQDGDGHSSGWTDSGAPAAVAAARVRRRCSERDSGDAAVSQDLRARFEACRLMQSELERSRSAAWAIAATYDGRAAGETAALPAASKPERRAEGDKENQASAPCSPARPDETTTLPDTTADSHGSSHHDSMRAKTLIQQELARRFTEMRTAAHPAEVQALAGETATAPARRAAAYEETFDTTFSSTYHSNQSSLTRSRYEAMKERIAIMKERLGKIVLAGSSPATYTDGTLTIPSSSASSLGTPTPRISGNRRSRSRGSSSGAACTSPDATGAASNALQLSHAITNLHAGTFGEFKRLEPLPTAAASKWSIEIDFLLSPCEQIIIRVPGTRSLPDGRQVEVLENRLRPDIDEFLPKLRGMDAAMRDMLKSFRELRQLVQYGAELGDTTATTMTTTTSSEPSAAKWWLDRPRVPSGGLPPGVQALLRRTWHEANDIRQMARSINDRVLRSIPLPEREYSRHCFGLDITETSTSALAALTRRSVEREPRVRDILPPDLYAAVTSDANFSAVTYARQAVLRLDEHAPLPSWDDESANARLTDLAERLERAEFVYCVKIDKHTGRHRFGTPWKRNKLETYYAARRRCKRGAHALRESFPGISQTSRDQTRIRFNRDVGTAVLEAYSRVLEARAAAVASRVALVLEADRRETGTQRNSSARGAGLVLSAARHSPNTMPPPPPPPPPPSSSSSSSSQEPSAWRRRWWTLVDDKRTDHETL